MEKSQWLANKLACLPTLAHPLAHWSEPLRPDDAERITSTLTHTSCANSVGHPLIHQQYQPMVSHRLTFLLLPAMSTNRRDGQQNPLMVKKTSSDSLWADKTGWTPSAISIERERLKHASLQEGLSLEICMKISLKMMPTVICYTLPFSSVCVQFARRRYRNRKICPTLNIQAPLTYHPHLIFIASARTTTFIPAGFDLALF